MPCGLPGAVKLTPRHIESQAGISLQCGHGSQITAKPRRQSQALSIVPTSEAMQCFDLVLFDTVDSFQPLSRLFLYLGGNAVLTLGGISAVHMPRILVFFGFKQQRPGVRQCKYTINNLGWPCCQNQTAEQDSTTKTDVSRLGAFRSEAKLTLNRSNSLTSIAKAQMVLWYVDRILHRKELF